MCQIESLARTVSAQAEILSKSWHNGDVDEVSPPGSRRTTIPTLDQNGEEARSQLIASLRNLEQLVLGPKDTMQSFYYKVGGFPSWSSRS